MPCIVEADLVPAASGVEGPWLPRHQRQFQHGNLTVVSSICHRYQHCSRALREADIPLARSTYQTPAEDEQVQRVAGKGCRMAAGIVNTTSAAT